MTTMRRYSFPLLVGLATYLFFPQPGYTQQQQDCSAFANNPPYYQRCLQIQQSVQRMQDSKDKRTKKSTDRRERALKSFRGYEEPQPEETAAPAATDPATTTDTTAGATPADTPTTGTPATTSQGSAIGIKPENMLIIDTSKLSKIQLDQIYAIMRQKQTIPAQQTLPQTTTRTITKPTPPAAPQMAPQGTQMIKLPDVGMGDEGFVPIEPVDPDRFSSP